MTGRLPALASPMGSSRAISDKATTGFGSIMSAGREGGWSARWCLIDVHPTEPDTAILRTHSLHHQREMPSNRHRRIGNVHGAHASAVVQPDAVSLDWHVPRLEDDWLMGERDV